MVTIFSSLVLVFFILLAGMTIIPVFFGAPWHPLSDENINRIIKFAGLKPGENFYDLGSGDGRVLIAASRKRFVRGVGVEIDPIKVWFSRYFVITEKTIIENKLANSSIYESKNKAQLLETLNQQMKLTNEEKSLTEEWDKLSSQIDSYNESSILKN